VANTFLKMLGSNVTNASAEPVFLRGVFEKPIISGKSGNRKNGSAEARSLRSHIMAHNFKDLVFISLSRKTLLLV
jgi:hypothetical protein